MRPSHKVDDKRPNDALEAGFGAEL